jgi:hypothetical protein
MDFHGALTTQVTPRRFPHLFRLKKKKKKLSKTKSRTWELEDEKLAGGRGGKGNFIIISLKYDFWMEIID